MEDNLSEEKMVPNDDQTDEPNKAGQPLRKVVGSKPFVFSRPFYIPSDGPPKEGPSPNEERAEDDT